MGWIGGALIGLVIGALMGAALANRNVWMFGNK